MKRHILPLLLTVFLCSMSLHAEESFRLTGFTAWQGECDTLAVTINNAVDVTAFQVDLSLPEGVVFDQVVLNADRAAADHVVSSTQQADGTIRLGCWSPTNSTFTGEVGPMVYVLVNVSEKMLSGMYEAFLTNGIITRAGGRTITPKEAKVRLYIGDYTVPAVDYSSPVNVKEQPYATAYKIRNVVADKLLSLNSAKSTPTIEKVDDSNPDQTFYLEPDYGSGRGVYQLRNSSGQYISLSGNWWEMKIVIADKPISGYGFNLDESGDLKYSILVDYSYYLCSRGATEGSSVILDWNASLSDWQFYTIPVDHTDYLRTLIERAQEWTGKTKGNRDRDLRLAIHNAQIVIDGCDSTRVNGTIETLIEATYAACDAYAEGDKTKAETVWGDPEYMLEGEYVVAYVDAAKKPHYLTIEGGAVRLTNDFSTFSIYDGNTTGGDGSTEPYAPYASFMESNGYYLSNPAEQSPNDANRYTISTQAVDGGCGLQHRTWESQVFFYNPMTDLYAIRLTNSVGTSWGPDFYAYVDPSTLQVSAAARSLDEALRTWIILRRDRAVARFLSTSGSCGTNVKWSFDATTRTLYISGSGHMTNFTNAESVPWNAYADLVNTVVVGGSVDRLGNRCFNGCTNLRTLVLATSVKPAIGSYAFRDVPAGLVVKVPDVTTYQGWGSTDEYLTGRELTTLISLPATHTYCASIVKVDAFKGDYGVTTPDLKLEKNVGEYSTDVEATITVNGSTSSFTAKYDYAIVPATVVARPRDYMRNYGAKNPTFYVAYEGFMGSESTTVLTQKATCSTDATPTSPVGDYVVTCSGAEADNYVFVYETSVLTVKAVRLRVKPDNVTRYYGEPNPEFTYTWTGFVNDEDASVLTELPVATVAADETSDAGNYTITLSGGAAQNYSITCNSGTLTVAPLPQTIDWEQSSATVAVGSTLELTATSSLGYPIEYKLSPSNLATLTGSTLTFDIEGELTVTATQPGDKNHAAAESVSHTFKIVSTGFNDQQADPSDDTLYDLQGRRILDPLHRGLYIRSGKKLLQSKMVK